VEWGAVFENIWGATAIVLKELLFARLSLSLFLEIDDVKKK